jgi:hypothetical protein
LKPLSDHHPLAAPATWRSALIPDICHWLPQPTQPNPPLGKEVLTLLMELLLYFFQIRLLPLSFSRRQNNDYSYGEEHYKHLTVLSGWGVTLK